MTYRELIARMRSLCAFGSDEEAERALAVSARVLGEVLAVDEAEAVAKALPEALARCVRGAEPRPALGLAEVYGRVARREGVRFGFGAEHAQVAFQIVGEALPEEVRARLQRHLGQRLGQLLEPRVLEPVPEREYAAPPPEPGQGTTLASGRPGSRHPLSEGRPAAGKSKAAR
jgi:uncharacterized protein (DUF2267 family)